MKVYMPMKTFRMACGLLTLTLGLGAPSLLAQHPDHHGDSEKRQRVCEDVRSTLMDGHAPRAEVERSASVFVRCGDQAPVAIAFALLHAKAGTFADTIAFVMAWDLSDKRLLAAVRQIARSTREPVTRRTTAVALLTRYADPSAYLDPSAADDSIPRMIGTVTDQVLIDGTQPMTSSDRRLALETIRLVGTDDPDPKLRKIGKYAAQQLALSVPPAP